MAQQTTAVKAPEAPKAPKVENLEENKTESIAEESVVTCCHHWVIQPADGPVSNGSCQVCGEIREFTNYVESATWGDSRTTGKSSSASASTESTSDDEAETDGPDIADDEPEPDGSEIELED
ncbi:MAG: hypothetical protein O2913_10345 [Chloroflexi bacterium]|nr:hypothetical protein [Chloroflexota bacterium]